MKTINGKNNLQVKDFLLHGGFEQENPEAIVVAIWIDENGKFHEAPIYKWEAAADDSEVYLYLGDKRPTSRVPDAEDSGENN